jgi:hypothetical protein
MPQRAMTERERARARARVHTLVITPEPSSYICDHTSVGTYSWCNCATLIHSCVFALATLLFCSFLVRLIGSMPGKLLKCSLNKIGSPPSITRAIVAHCGRSPSASSFCSTIVRYRERERDWVSIGSAEATIAILHVYLCQHCCKLALVCSTFLADPHMNLTTTIDDIGGRRNQ